MITISEVYDTRNQKIVVGDIVAYPGPADVSVHLAEDEDCKILRIKQHLKSSRVARIDGGDFGGFGDCGRTIWITLEDGHIETGDSEHGGWNLLKLAEVA